MAIGFFYEMLGLLFVFTLLGNVAGAGKGTSPACRGRLSILIKFSTGAAPAFLLLFADGHDRIPEQQCYDGGNEYIG